MQVMKIKAVGGAVVIAVGLLLLSTGLGLGFAGDAFQDIYPVNDEWSNNGTHDNTFSDVDGNLLVDNTTENTGTFTSDVRTNGEIEINNIVYETSNIKDTGTQRRINLTVKGLNENDAIVDEVKYELENGRYSVPVSDLQGQKYNGYKFVVDLEAEGDTSPELNSLRIQGDTYTDDSDLLSTAIGWLLVFAGIIMVVRDVF